MATTLGRPAITPPRALDLRGLTDLTSSVRQRVEAIERAVAAVTAQAGQTTFSSSNGSSGSIVLLQARVAAIEFRLIDIDAAILALVSAPASTPAASDWVLYDDSGRALLTGAGGALLIGP